jgi:DtxR family Mn-dependent transcriptional regulator
MPKVKMLSASMEDYLEAIFHIAADKQAARAKDIAKRLKVNNSSVTGALRILSRFAISLALAACLSAAI